MKVVKEYSNQKTKIRIHEDYINSEEGKIINEVIISMMVNYLQNKNI